MATKINQKEYLKKYLSNDVDTADTHKKKKKKKSKSAAKVATAASTNVRIIDDDIDISRMRRLDDDDLEAYAIGEEAPQIVGVVDDRPAELIASEDYKQSEKWKVLRTVDGALTVNQMGGDGRTRGTGAIGDVERAERRRFTRYESDEEVAQAAGGDLSPVRRGGKRKGEEKRRSADRSPPRRTQQRRRRRSDSSSRSPAGSPPPRAVRRSKSPRRRDGSRDRKDAKHRRQSPRDDKRREERRRRTPDVSPPRRKRHEAAADSDASPPRCRNRSPSPKPRRRTPDVSPPRRKKHEAAADSDASPPRRRNRSPSPKPRHRHRRRSSSATPDASPPRRHAKPAAIIKREPSDSDQSPQRQRSTRRDSDASPPRRTQRRPSADASPPRRPHRNSRSPARAIKTEKTSGKSSKMSRWSRDRSTAPPSTDKMSRTLDGKAAGLQSASAVRKESDKFRQREAELFAGMSASVSGRDAEAVVRDRRTGKVRDVEAEMEVEHEKMRKELERKAVYDRWGKGVKQLEAHQERRADEQHEASKPLARYADDEDRDALLRERVRDDDPMLEYVRGKQAALEVGKPQRPVYRGQYAANRFGIRPGYRWDGVDRSNGFEKRWFDVQSTTKAAEEETYKYMTEDM